MEENKKERTNVINGTPIVGKVSKTSPLFIRDYIDSGNKILRVYYDTSKGKFYVDTFAAYALHIISYDEACELSNGGMILCEISYNILKILERYFMNNIIYKDITEGIYLTSQNTKNDSRQSKQMSESDSSYLHEPKRLG